MVDIINTNLEIITELAKMNQGFSDNPPFLKVFRYFIFENDILFIDKGLMIISEEFLISFTSYLISE